MHKGYPCLGDLDIELCVTSQTHLMWCGAVQGVRLVTAKVGEANGASLQMFSRLGFSIQSRSSIFKEVTLNRDLDQDTATLLQATAAQLEIGPYT